MWYLQLCSSALSRPSRSLGWISFLFISSSTTFSAMLLRVHSSMSNITTPGHCSAKGRICQDHRLVRGERDTGMREKNGGVIRETRTRCVRLTKGCDERGKYKEEPKNFGLKDHCPLRPCPAPCMYVWICVCARESRDRGKAEVLLDLLGLSAHQKNWALLYLYEFIDHHCGNVTRFSPMRFTSQVATTKDTDAWGICSMHQISSGHESCLLAASWACSTILCLI